MHGNYEFCDTQLASLFRVGQIPDPYENVVWKLCPVKDLLCRNTYMSLATKLFLSGFTNQVESHSERQTPRTERHIG